MLIVPLVAAPQALQSSSAFMAAQAKRHWEQIAKHLDSTAHQLQLQGSSQRQQGKSSMLRDLLAVFQNQPAASRATWKKLLQDKVSCSLFFVALQLLTGPCMQTHL